VRRGLKTCREPAIRVELPSAIADIVTPPRARSDVAALMRLLAYL